MSPSRQNDDGFPPVDRPDESSAWDVYAAGDVTSFPVKHGGLAAQEADAVAESIAAWSGAPVEATPFRPVLRRAADGCRSAAPGLYPQALHVEIDLEQIGRRPARADEPQ